MFNETRLIENYVAGKSCGDLLIMMLPPHFAGRNKGVDWESDLVQDMLGASCCGQARPPRQLQQGAELPLCPHLIALLFEIHQVQLDVLPDRRVQVGLQLAFAEDDGQAMFIEPPGSSCAVQNAVA